MKCIGSFLALSLMVSLLQAAPSTEEMVEKAREYVGGDGALDGLKSIYYEADFESSEGDTGSITIIFQKPMQQRIEVKRGEMGEITALNDFDGWRKTYDLNDESRWSMTLLEAQKIRELQANTWENLNFFRGIERRRGWIDHEGLTEIDGREAVRLVFNHPRGIVFTRFFDVETGRLMLTHTHEGSEIRERGKQTVEGIVFPETLTMRRDGEVVNEVHFRKIKVNKEFDESLFDVPSMAPGQRSPVLSVEP